MAEYFFLTTLFPTVDPDIPLEISIRELLLLYRDNLTEKDWAQVVVLLRETDLNNLRSFFSNKNFFDPRGSLSREQLEEVLVEEGGVVEMGKEMLSPALPPYVYDFLARYENKSEREKRFDELLASYYREEGRNSRKGWKSPSEDDFLYQWLEFERKLRLNLMALRGKQQGKDLSELFLFEDPEDDTIQYFLAQKDAAEIEPEERFLELKLIMQEEDPLLAARKLLDFRLRELKRLIGFDHFSMRRVLAFFIEVLLIENWQRLDREAGKHVLERIVR